MRRTLSQLALAALLAGLAHPVVAAETPDPTSTLTGPYTVLDPESVSAFWKQVFKMMAVPGPVESGFVENRYLAIRRTPVTITGTMRSQPGVGVSIAHTRDGKEDVVLVTEGGLLRREDDGKFAKIPYDVAATRAPRVLLSVMAFDPAKVARDFTAEGRHEGEEWSLRLRPRDPAMAKAVSMMTLDGDAKRIRKITIYDGDRVRLEIFIHSAKFPEAFSKETLGAYFGR